MAGWATRGIPSILNPYVFIGPLVGWLEDRLDRRLVRAFLLSLVEPRCQLLLRDLPRNWRHGTGKRDRDAGIPLPGIRSALGSLRLTHHPNLSISSQNWDDSCALISPSVFPNCRWS